MALNNVCCWLITDEIVRTQVLGLFWTGPVYKPGIHIQKKTFIKKEDKTLVLYK